MTNYIPKSSMLFAAIGDELKGSDAGRLSISRGVFKQLLQMALRSAAFDQDVYLEQNPDLREAHKAGKIENLQEHWILSGYLEGRNAAKPKVDEAWYLKKYPDVKLAIEAGGVANASEHFANSGESEWRIPNPAAESEVHGWRQAFLSQVPPYKR